MGMFSRAKKSYASDLPVRRTINKVVTPSDPYERRHISAEIASVLLKACTCHIKKRCLSLPLLMLPFRPAFAVTSLRTLINNILRNGLRPAELEQELMLVDPLTLVAVVRWVCSRIDGGIISLPEYELFVKGERRLSYAEDAFSHLVDAIFGPERLHQRAVMSDLLDLIAAVAAHEGLNGHNGITLARLTSSLLFQDGYKNDDSVRFMETYASWSIRATAAQHLFIAYLRNLSSCGTAYTTSLPAVLTRLMKSATYPPVSAEVKPSLQQATLLQVSTKTSSTRLLHLIRLAASATSPDKEPVLDGISLSDIDLGLSEESYRVIKSIDKRFARSQSYIPGNSQALDWNSFQDFGFAPVSDNQLRSSSTRKCVFGPSIGTNWDRFSEAGFGADDSSKHSMSVLLPCDLQLPQVLEKPQDAAFPTQANLCDIIKVSHFDCDDAFWGAWITSLASEVSQKMHSSFTRCVVFQLKQSREWYIIEELPEAVNKLPLEIKAQPRSIKVSNILRRKHGMPRMSDETDLGPHPTTSNRDLEAANTRLETLLKAQLAVPRRTLTILDSKSESLQIGDICSGHGTKAKTQLDVDVDVATAASWALLLDETTQPGMRDNLVNVKSGSISVEVKKISRYRSDSTALCSCNSGDVESGGSSSMRSMHVSPLSSKMSSSLHAASLNGPFTRKKLGLFHTKSLRYKARKGLEVPMKQVTRSMNIDDERVAAKANGGSGALKVDRVPLQPISKFSSTEHSCLSGNDISSQSQITRMTSHLAVNETVSHRLDSLPPPIRQNRMDRIDRDSFNSFTRPWVHIHSGNPGSPWKTTDFTQLVSDTTSSLSSSEVVFDGAAEMSTTHDMADCTKKDEVTGTRHLRRDVWRHATVYSSELKAGLSSRRDKVLDQLDERPPSGEDAEILHARVALIGNKSAEKGL